MTRVPVHDRQRPLKADMKHIAYLQVKRVQLRQKEHSKERYDRDIVTE